MVGLIITVDGRVKMYILLGPPPLEVGMIQQGPSPSPVPGSYHPRPMNFARIHHPSACEGFLFDMHPVSSNRKPEHQLAGFWEERSQLVFEWSMFQVSILHGCRLPLVLQDRLPPESQPSSKGLTCSTQVARSSSLAFVIPKRHWMFVFHLS